MLVTRNYKHGKAKERTPEYMLWKAAKRRSSAKKIPFDISHEDIVIPNRCPILGIELEVNKAKDGRKGPKPNSPSLDKLIPSKGYVKGNIAVISHKANLMKSNGSLEEIEAIIKWMEERNYQLETNE